MIATPAQINFINNLRAEWAKYLDNQQAADTSDDALFMWLNVQMPTDVVRWYCEKQEISAPRKPKGSNPAMAGAFGKAPVLSQEEWDAQHAAYMAEMNRLEPLAKRAFIGTVTQRARAWADAMTVDTDTLSKEDASAVIDRLKNH